MENENISAEELQQSLNQSPGQFFVIDLMNKEDFAARHIPGAVNIPVVELEQRVNEIPANQTVVVTCARGLMKSDLGLQQLQKSGFTHVKKLTGGINAWYDLQSKL